MTALARPSHRALARVRRSSAATAAPATRSAPSTPASSASARSRSATTPAALARVTRDEIEAGPHSLWRYAGPAARRPEPRDPRRLRHRHDAADPRRPARPTNSASPRRCGSRTTRPTRPTRSRTASSRWRSPPRASWASSASRAHRPATSATRWPRTRRASACRRSCSCPSDLEPAEDRPDRDLRRHAGRHRGLLRRRQPAVLGAVRDRRVRERPASSTSTSARTTPRVRRRSGYEVAEQLGWRLPGQYVAPMASGSMLTKIHKAFKELVAAGLVPPSPWTVFGAQSAGCSPIATAFADGSDDVVQPVQADRHRQVAEHRQPGRRPVRARRRALDRRRDGRGRRRRDPRGHPAAGPHHRRVRRDRRRRDRGRAAKLVASGAARHRRSRPSSTTPATG